MKFPASMRFAVPLAGCLIVATGILLLGAAAAPSQQASDTDKKFVHEALEGGMAEVSLGHLAAEKGASEDVKEFGQRMVTDHTRLEDRMKVVAGDIGVSQSESTTIGETADKTTLSMLSGKTFDNAYIKEMLKDHKDDLKVFQEEEADGTSPEVKHAAREGAAVIQAHLRLIEKIAAAHNISPSAAVVKPSPYGGFARGR